MPVKYVNSAPPRLVLLFSDTGSSFTAAEAATPPSEFKLISTSHAYIAIHCSTFNYAFGFTAARLKASFEVTRSRILEVSRCLWAGDSKFYDFPRQLFFAGKKTLVRGSE